MYLKVYMCLHLVALLTYFILPKFVGIEKRSISITSNNTTSFNNTTTLHHNYDNANNTKYNNDICDKTTTTSTTTTTTFTTTNNLLDNKMDNKNNIQITNRYHHRTNNNNNINGNALNTENFAKNFANKTKNIEDFFDKTVTGIVDFKDDLMKINSLNHLYPSVDGHGNGNIDNYTQSTASTTVDQFIKKEIDALHQATMIPAVLSNGHAK